MAQNSLNIVLQSNPNSKDTLSEQWVSVFDNLQKSTLSMLYKNTDVVSGSAVKGGILHFRRFANAAIQTYGTARTANKGNSLKAKPVQINIDDDKEFIEEVEEKDLQLYGFGELIVRRTQNQEGAMRRYYERKFFNTAALGGSAYTITKTDIQEKIEEIIQKVETIKNNFVDGVERDNIVLFLTPAVYGQIRIYLDKVTLPNVNSTIGEFGSYHGVIIHSTIYLPDTIDYLIMVKGSVGQPIIQNLQEPFIPQFADAIAFGMYLYAGHGTVMPDLVFFAGTLGAATATTVYGGGANKSTITPTSVLSDSANTFWYKAHASVVAAPTYGAGATAAGFTKMTLTDGAQTITFATETKIRVAEVDASGRIIKSTDEITIVKIN